MVRHNEQLPINTGRINVADGVDNYYSITLAYVGEAVVFNKKKIVFRRPIKCPQGHHMISWFYKEDEVLCNLCAQTYRMSQCFCMETESELGFPLHEFKALRG